MGGVALVPQVRNGVVDAALKEPVCALNQALDIVRHHWRRVGDTGEFAHNEIQDAIARGIAVGINLDVPAPTCLSMCAAKAVLDEFLTGLQHLTCAVNESGCEVIPPRNCVGLYLAQQGLPVPRNFLVHCSP